MISKYFLTKAVIPALSLTVATTVGVAFVPFNNGQSLASQLFNNSKKTTKTLADISTKAATTYAKNLAKESQYDNSNNEIGYIDSDSYPVTIKPIDSAKSKIMKNDVPVVESANISIKNPEEPVSTVQATSIQTKVTENKDKEDTKISSDISVNNLIVTLGKDELPSEEQSQYSYADIKWENLGSETADKYVVYLSNSLDGDFKEATVTESPVAHLKVLDGFYRVKVVGFKDNIPGKVEGFASFDSTKQNAGIITFDSVPTTIALNKENTVIAHTDSAVSQEITWSSSNSDVASVKEGTIKGLSLGKSTITATAHNGLSKSFEITVTNLYPTEIKLIKTSATVEIKKTAQFQAVTDDAIDKAITWKTSNPSIATISAEGILTAKTVGEVKISAIAHSEDTVTPASADFTVKVVKPAPATATKPATAPATKPATAPTTKPTTAPTTKSATAPAAKPATAPAAKPATAPAAKPAPTPTTKSATAPAAKPAPATKPAPVIDNNSGVEGMVRWAKAIANDDRFGYSMGLVRGIGQDRFDYYTVKGASRDYDCASFVAAAVAHGYKNSPYMNEFVKRVGPVSSVQNALIKAGWKDLGWIPVSQLKRGDILSNPRSHIEIFIGEKDRNGNWLDVGAHDDYDGRSGDSRGNEISIETGRWWFHNQYTHVLRAPQ